MMNLRKTLFFPIAAAMLSILAGLSGAQTLPVGADELSETEALNAENQWTLIVSRADFARLEGC